VSCLNDINLDTLCFIRLKRVVNEFNDRLSCIGFEEWIQLRGAEFLARYSFVSSIPRPNSKNSVIHVSGRHECRSPFVRAHMRNAIQGGDVEALYVKSSGAVRTVHSLMCLPVELYNDNKFTASPTQRSLTANRDWSIASASSSHMS
jgi:hypothetical protein